MIGQNRVFRSSWNRERTCRCRRMITGFALVLGFVIACVFAGEVWGSQKALLVLVDSESTAQLCSEYVPWKETLQAQGYVVIERIVDGAAIQPPEVRALIRQVYERTDITLEGAILIGAIPAAYATIHTGDYSDPQAQVVWLSLDAVDMYYEDLDGAWDHVTPEQLDGLIGSPPSCVAEVNLYDSVRAFRGKYIVSLNVDHEWDPWSIPDKSQYNIEIWVSRIMTQNLDVPGTSAMDLMNRYFGADIALRNGTTHVSSVANILCSGEGYNDQGMDYSAIFVQTKRQEKVSKADYLQVLARPEGSALTYLTAHSGPAGHAMYASWLSVDELLGSPKTSAFYLLNACSACRWDWGELQAAAPTGLALPKELPIAKNVSPNYLGGVYVFDRPAGADNRGLVAVGFTGVGGFNNLDKFTDAYQLGEDYGKMFVEWFNFNLGANFAAMNFIILGDPSLRPHDGLYPCTEQNSVLTNTSWHMISLPGDLCEACAVGGSGDLVCALSDDLDPCFIFHYDPGVGGYVMAPPSENIQYHAGMGFWVRTYEDNASVDAEVQVPAEAVEAPLGNGWNQIGNPFTFAVALSNVTVKYQGNEVSLAQAQSNGWVSAYLFAYDTANGGYRMLDPSNGQLEPWAGYWMRAYVDCEVCISPIPAPPAPPSALLQPQAFGLGGIPMPPSPPNFTKQVNENVVSQLTVLNVPNPIRSQHTTTFKVEGKGAELVQAIRVEIYDQSGQKVFTQDINAKELEWHTDKDAGELLANGVYLYQVWVEIGGKWYPTGVRKLAVVR